MSIYKKQMGALVVGQFSSLVLSFSVPMILAHLLSNENFGLYAQFNLITGFAMSFLSLGVSSELYFFYPRSNSQQRKIIISQSFLILLVLGVISVILFLIPSIRALLVTSEQLESNYKYLLFAILFAIPTVIISTLPVLNHDNRTSAIYLPASTLVRVILIFLFYWHSPTIESIFFALLTNYFLVFLFVVYYVFREVKKEEGGKLFDFTFFKKQLSYAMPLGFANSARIFAQQLDKLILLSFVSPASYAIYSIASYGVPGLNQLYLSITQVYIPRMSSAFHDSNIQQVKELYKSMVSKTLSYTIPLVLIVVVFAPVIVPFLFSEKYVESIPYFQIYLFTFIFSAMGNGLVLRSTGETRKSLYAYLYSLIFIIPFTYFAIKFYGLNGAIISAFISSVLPRFFLTGFDLAVLRISISEIFPWKDIAKIVSISLLFSLPFVAITQLFTLNILLSILSIIVYIISVFLIEANYNVFIITKKELVGYFNRYSPIKLNVYIEK